MSPPVAGTHRLREEALALVVSGQEANLDKRLLAVQARALVALNRTDEVRPIVERLTRLGYRHPTFVKEVVQGSGWPCVSCSRSPFAR
jgi:hypothetical protein